MASLATPNPKPSKRPVSARQKWRAKTNYEPKRFTGFAPISFAMVAEVGRLTAGKATQLLYVSLTASLGQIVKKGQPFKETSAEHSTSDLAELCACDERTIQRELGDLKQRKVILWEQPKKGVNVITPLFRSWEKLPDYKPAPVEEPKLEADDEPETGDPAQADKQTTYLTKTPVRVAAGKKSKAYKVECGVSALQFDVRQLDADCSAMVKDGVLLVTLEPRWDGKTIAGPALQQKGIEEKPRQGCRISPNPAESKGTKGERGKKGEQVAVKHPRAEELSSLFDPLIHRWCGKTLSGDPQALLQSCVAIGETPHDVLVKAGVERGSRTLTPLHVLSLCKEIEHNWRRGIGLPQTDKLPTREEIMAMAEADRKELAEKRAAARRGRVA
jgi:hypothetical protein